MWDISPSVSSQEFCSQNIFYKTSCLEVGINVRSSIPLLSLNELGEMSQTITILGNFVNNPDSNSHWLIVFGKYLSLINMLCICLKHVSCHSFFSWAFEIFLINSISSFCLNFDISSHQINTVRKYILQMQS